MTAETDAAYDRRRAGEEHALADRATDPAEAIPHRDLAELHAAALPDDEAGPAPRSTPLDVANVDGDVVVTLPTGAIVTLTPSAAFASADRLTEHARQAARHRPA